MGHDGDNGPECRFGALVRAYRREAGLTQGELAAKTRLSVAALRDIEQGRRHRPRPGTLSALCDALGLDPEHAAKLVSAGRGPTVSGTSPQDGSLLTLGQARPGQGLRVAALGPLEAWRDGSPLSLGPPARRAVLGLLLIYPGRLVRRDAIIDVLWGQEPPRTAVGLVQAHVSRLRQVLESRTRPPGDAGTFHSVRGAYRLSLLSEELDLLVFRDLAARAVAARARGDDVTACELYEQAIGLWRGDPLADVDVLSGYPGITLLRQQLVAVLLRYAETACALGQYRRVLPRLQALAAAEPLNESAHACLMIALAGSGQQAAAIRIYEDLRSRLDRELGLYPGEELVEAHVRVLRQDIRAGRARARICPRCGTSRRRRGAVVPRQLPAASRYFIGRIRQLDILYSLRGTECAGDGRRGDLRADRNGGYRQDGTGGVLGSPGRRPSFPTGSCSPTCAVSAPSAHRYRRTRWYPVSCPLSVSRPRVFRLTPLTGPPFTVACWPTAACSSCWTTRRTRSRSGRCYRDRQGASC